MFVIFEPIDESESLTGELPRAIAFAQPPMVGGKVSLGGEPRWTVVAIDVYYNQAEPLYVAHCAVDVQAVGRRHTWTKVQRGKTRDINLTAFWGDNRDLGMQWNLTGRSPQVGEALLEFDAATHQVYPQPWKVATVAEYKPSDRACACYSSVLLAWCEADGSIGAKPAEIATAV